MENLINKYIELSKIQKSATESGDYRTNNKATKDRFKIVDVLKKNNQLVLLTELLNHEEINVRLWAAYDLLSENLSYKKCIDVLKRIYSLDKGVIGWGAEMTLKRFNEF